MSVSRRALFNNARPPRPLLPDPHGMLNGLVEQIGVLAKRAYRSRPRARARGPAAELLQGDADDLLLGRVAPGTSPGPTTIDEVQPGEPAREGRSHPGVTREGEVHEPDHHDNRPHLPDDDGDRRGAGSDCPVDAGRRRRDRRRWGPGRSGRADRAVRGRLRPRGDTVLRRTDRQPRPEDRPGRTRHDDRGHRPQGERRR
jgi:hypothetical protein